MSMEYIITALIVVLLPGTGVIYTVSTGILKGSRLSFVAAIGCTLGIVPHILASVLGLAALLHTSALAFQFVKYAGFLYLLYLAYNMWHAKGSMDISQEGKNHSPYQTCLHGFLINILNPKLSIFFLAFLPQFIAPQTETPMMDMIGLGGVFMLITLIVFIAYGLAAAWLRQHVLQNPRILSRLQKGFSLTFVALGVKLALEEQK